eukprot:3358662-Pleurochrysis_carterae.AAC.1
MRQVAQYALGGEHHICGGTRHRAAEHTHCVGDVRARLRGALEQCSNQRLISGFERRLGQNPLRLCQESCVHKTREIFRGGRM